MTTLTTPITIREALDKALGGSRKNEGFVHNPQQHDQESRLKITKIFLYCYFLLIAGAFIFSLLYNWSVAYLNFTYNVTDGLPTIEYIDVVNTVSIVTTTLSSGVGFVIGYYFKNKSG